MITISTSNNPVFDDNFSTVPWVLEQTWQDVVFAHWRVEPDSISRVLPPGLTLDVRDGNAWLSLVLHRVHGCRVRGMPPLPGLSAFAACNLRTYVVHDGRPGVYFLSLDAGNTPVVAAARIVFHLPYFRAKFEIQTQANHTRYRLERVHDYAPAGLLDCAYERSTEAIGLEPGSVDAWLINRYTFYASRLGVVYRGDIHHEPWEIYRAKLVVHQHTMFDAYPIRVIHDDPLVHYAPGVTARLGWRNPVAIVKARENNETRVNYGK